MFSKKINNISIIFKTRPISFSDLTATAGERDRERERERAERFLYVAYVNDLRQDQGPLEACDSSFPSNFFSTTSVMETSFLFSRKS